MTVFRLGDQLPFIRANKCARTHRHKFLEIPHQNPLLCLAACEVACMRSPLDFHMGSSNVGFGNCDPELQCRSLGPYLLVAIQPLALRSSMLFKSA